MTLDVIVTIGQRAIYVLLIVIAPVLLTSLVVGLLISIFQATTQINEQTLTFVPKIFAAFLVIAFLGGWMFKQVIELAREIMTFYMNFV